MCFPAAELRSKLITDDHSNFSLLGMISPTFQNLGESDVLINGLLCKSGESYGVNVPSVELTNEIAINFISDNAAERKVIVGYVSLKIEN